MISIHAPRVGRDGRNSQRGSARSATFQSTRPVWGATGRGIIVARSTRDFNPRAPCGARPFAVTSDGVEYLFQSTRPVWGATPIVRSMPAP